MRQQIRTWARFKLLISSLDTNNIAYEFYQLDDYENYYQLVLINAINFSIAIKKETEEATDYENNYKDNALICNCSTDI